MKKPRRLAKVIPIDPAVRRFNQVVDEVILNHTGDAREARSLKDLLAGCVEGTREVGEVRILLDAFFVLARSSIVRMKNEHPAKKSRRRGVRLDS